MFNFAGSLLTHAVKNAWANPGQDRQLLIKPMAVTPSYGVRGLHRTPHLVYPAPSSTERWMIYEYGQLNPARLGLDRNNMVWRDAAAIMEQEKIIVFPMINQRMVQFDSVKIMRVNGNNLLFAVNIDQNQDLFSASSDLYIRFYSNSWFAQNTSSVGILAKSKYCVVEQDIADTIADYLRRGFTGGLTYWFKNGYLIDQPTVNTVNVGDTLQWVYDDSGIRSFDVPLSDLATFSSARDSIAKSTLLTPEFVDGDFIFYDDVEFFACGTDLDGRTIGCYYDRQSEDQLSQITHRDWAFNTQRLNDVITQHAGAIPVNGAFIRVSLRKTLNEPITVGDGQYLKDFYSLDYPIRYDILSGGAGTFTQWRASNLEDSAFMKWLSTAGTDLTASAMKHVYNYYGLVQALSYPEKVSDGTWTLPEVAREGCLVLNLDANGDLLSTQEYANGDNPGLVHSPGSTVKDIIVYGGECLTSATSMDLGVDPGNDRVSDLDEERFFSYSGSSEWNIAEEGLHYNYNALTKRVEWSPVLLSADKAKRSSRHMACRTVTVPFNDIAKGINVFSNGSVPTSKIDFGRVDVWVNKKKLAADLEVTHKNFKVYITSIEHLDYVSSTEECEVTIVAHSLPSDTEDGHYGFMVENMVNHDQDYDLVKNRNLKLFINGSLTSVDEVYLAEDYRGDNQFRFPVTAVIDWREGTEYPVGTLVKYRNAFYLAEAVIPPRQTFNENEWFRVWTSIPYHLTSTPDKHVVLYLDGDNIMMKVVYENGAVINNGSESLVTTTEDLKMAVSYPIISSWDNAKLYHFSGTGNRVSRFIISQFSDSRKDAKITSTALSNYLGSVVPQVEVTQNITIPKQYEVVSPFLWAVTQALQSGTINPSGSDLSDAAIDFMTRDLQYLLAFDPCGQSDIDYGFVACFAHPRKDPIGLSSVEVSLLARLNEYFFNNRVSISRDYFIG